MLTILSSSSVFCVCLQWASCAPGLISVSGSGSWLLRSRQPFSHTHTHTAVGADTSQQRKGQTGPEREREEGTTKPSFMRAAHPPLAVVLQSIFRSAFLLFKYSRLTRLAFTFFRDINFYLHGSATYC